MDLFSKFLPTQPQPKAPLDPVSEFHRSWTIIKTTLQHPDERQLTRGISATDVPTRLRALGDALVNEMSAPEYIGGTGPCMEYLLKNDVLSTLVKLSEPDRPAGILPEVLRTISNMVVLLDEQFLIHTAVHKAIIRLLRICTEDEFQERVDGRDKVMGAAAETVRAPPSDYELDLVDLLCVLCSRIRTYRHLLLIFFHDKNWFQSESNPSEEEGEEDDDGENPPLSPTESMSTITSAPSAKKPEYEFLLFNYLLRYVHREGQIGDFARAGVLFLMDVAIGAPSGDSRQLEEPSEVTKVDKSGHDPIGEAAVALAEYILDGDFAEVLGAGLVAVYSLLPSKLELRRNPSDKGFDNTMILGGAGLFGFPEDEDEELERTRMFGLVASNNPDFRSKLDHFLKIIEFLQDLLRRNEIKDEEHRLEPAALVGSAISSAVLQAVKQIFLENVLYPSILESSDMDGSAVAVISYIDVTLRTLPDGPLADLFISFLMSEDGIDSTKSLTATRRDQKEARVRRRKSSAMLLLELEAPKEPRQTSYFSSLGRFTLKDLLFSNLKSKSEATATSVLQLLQTLLVYHPRFTVDRLLIKTGLPESILRPNILPSVPDSPISDSGEFHYPGVDFPKSGDDELLSGSQEPDTTFATHERELGLYLNLLSRVDPTYDDQAFSTGYDNYLRDAIESVQVQQTAMTIDSDSEALKYALDPHDTLLRLILNSTRNFYAHTAEYNIALTGALSAIACCPTRSLAGWMTFAHPKVPREKYAKSHLEAEDDGDDRSIDFEIDEILSKATLPPATSVDDAEARPVLHSILRELISHIDEYRNSVMGFDQLLNERRQGLMFSESLMDALNLSIDVEDDNSFFSSIRSTLSPPPPKTPTAKQVPSTPPLSRTMSMAASLVPSFLTPKKEKSSQSKGGLLSPFSTSKTSAKDRSVHIEASPFGPHYEKTNSITVESYTAPKLDNDDPISDADEADDEKVGTRDEEDDNPFSDQWTKKKKEKKMKRVTLSELLDSIVILEEFLKELSAIIQARRSLGIDGVRYL